MITFKQFLQEATDARKATKERNNHKNLLIRLAAVQAGGGSGIYGDTEENLNNKIKLAQRGIDLYGGANKTQAGIQDEPEESINTPSKRKAQRDETRYGMGNMA